MAKDMSAIDTYFGGNERLFALLVWMTTKLPTPPQDQRAEQQFVRAVWANYTQGTDGFPSLTLIERYWFSVMFDLVGLSFFDEIIGPCISESLTKTTKEELDAAFEKSKQDGVIPSNIPTMQDYLALNFARPKTRLYTNDPFYQALGLKTGKDFDKLSFFDATLAGAKMVVDGTFYRLHNATFHAYQRSFEGRSSEVAEDEVFERTPAGSTVEDEIRFLDDADRLSQFCDLAGEDMSDLTEADNRRILELLTLLDAGYDFASKQGVSMAAYYGERADSEKTQRQRLFKKIREARSKTK